ncbi:MAG: ABC transporter substrate-binding protein [Reyranellaceae bacterium]
MHDTIRRRFLGSIAAAFVALAVGIAGPSAVRAESNEISIAKAHGISYLPFMMIEHFKLIEKHAAKVGIANAKVNWQQFANAAGMNDALLSGNVDVAGIGTPGFLIMWDRTKGNLNVRGVAAMNSIPMVLNTREDRIKSIKDLKETDRIALAGVKVSVTAIVLQMAAEQAFGKGKAFALDHLTVSMAHPDGLAALLSGKNEVNLHFTSPPFSTLELKQPGIRTILNSDDVLGGPATYVMVEASEKFHKTKPKLYAAFLAALKESIAMIKEDHKRAAQTYLAVTKSNEPIENILANLAEPSVDFTTTPNGVMKYAEFLHRIGTIKNMPSSWKDLFLPEIHNEPGS